jgi:predicted MFS family arabinose efflux permease
MMQNQEPVAVGAAFTALVNSVLAVVVLVGWWSPTPDTIAALNLVAVNVAVFLGALYGRSLVMPVINVPAVKKAAPKKKPA